MNKLLVIAMVVALAFGGAGFALGVSTGARAEDEPRASQPATPTPTPRTTAVPAPVSTAAPTPPPVAATTPAPQPATVSRDEGEDARLRVRRLVVTSGIAGHEPDGSIGTMAVGEHERVYAFVELANGGGAGSVVVTFERDGLVPTGQVELEVPGRVGRWRTWAFSRGVTSPGEWRAVVRDEGGRRLAEQPFVVE